MVDRACVIAYQEGFARPGDRIAITAGIPPLAKELNDNGSQDAAAAIK